MTSGATLPVASVRHARRWSWWWILPPLALVVGTVLGWRAWVVRGPEAVVAFAEGHGLKAGDRVRYRGIEVGEVTGVRLHPDAGGVLAELRLASDARACVRAGSLYWVVRPQVGIAGIRGLDTLVGARYLAVLPGGGEPQRMFVGLDEPPVPETLLDGALDILVQADGKGGLRSGAPVLYRQMQVGSVVSVGLASDASAVEARLRIRPEYARLVREQSRFWDAGGLEVDAGITGIRVRLSSLETLAAGGVAFATPPQAGPAVTTGHRFPLHARPEEDWLAWKPALALDQDPSAAALMLPRPLRATLDWEEDRWWWRRNEQRTGWVLAVSGGLLAPAELVTAPGEARAGTVALEVAGVRYPLTTAPAWTRDGIAFLPISPDVAPWPAERVRAAPAPEDVVLVADPSDPPLPVSGARLAVDGERWAVDPSFSFAPGWHGAIAVAAADGKLVGVLLVKDRIGAIAPWR